MKHYDGNIITCAAMLHGVCGLPVMYHIRIHWSHLSEHWGTQKNVHWKFLLSETLDFFWKIHTDGISSLFCPFQAE